MVHCGQRARYATGLLYTSNSHTQIFLAKRHNGPVDARNRVDYLVELLHNATNIKIR